MLPPQMHLIIIFIYIYFYLIIPVSSFRLLQDASMNHELSRTNYLQIFSFNSAVVPLCIVLFPCLYEIGHSNA